MQPFTLGLIQMAPERDKPASLAKAAHMVAQAARQGATLVCLPELFATDYFCINLDSCHFDLAEGVDGPTVSAMARAAREAGVTLVAPFYERRGPGLYHNSLVVLGPDGAILGHYRKMHIPDDPGFTEKFYFAPGDTGFPVVRTPAGLVGPLICWDQWFPEAARLTALAGAEILLYPTAIGWLAGEKDTDDGRHMREAWTLMQRSHAIANGLFVAAVNRVGLERGPHPEGHEIEFWGGSFVAGPMGQILAQASDDKEEILLARIDPAQLEATRRTWPFLRDRRVDAYQGLTARSLA